MSKKPKVESFDLDHTKVKAPFIRKVTVYTGAKGDTLTKFDLRFMQPNEEFMKMSGIHTLEHLLATYLRESELCEDIIDLSPMGCRTGFYLTIWGDRDPLKIWDILRESLKKVVESTSIPADNEVQCGNYKEHSLSLAKEYANKFLETYN